VDNFLIRNIFSLKRVFSIAIMAIAAMLVSFILVKQYAIFASGNYRKLYL